MMIRQSILSWFAGSPIDLVLVGRIVLRSCFY